MRQKINFLFALMCGTMVANLYYAQPILSSIAKSLDIPIKNIATITTSTQIGYALGMFFLVPLSDVLENKKLIIFVMLLNVLALIFLGFSESFLGILIMSLLVGLSASAVQMIVPFGASMTPEKNRGATIGIIMSGLLFGIMLARPLSSFLSGFMGWNIIFFISAGITFFLAVVFAWNAPKKSPAGKMHYFALIASMFELFLHTPILRQRGFYHFLAFGAFCIFWIVAPLVLIERFGFLPSQVALFALIGIVGAMVAPIAGRLADRGKADWGSNLALLSVGISMLAAILPIENAWLGFIWLGICGIVLDFGVSLNLVIGQRIIYALPDGIRSRLNALYMVMFFIGGALGSYFGGLFYAQFGYKIAFLLGGVLGGIGFFAFRWNSRKTIKMTEISTKTHE